MLIIKVLFLLLVSNIFLARNYFVDQNHRLADDLNIGTEKYPFKTIQAAINKAYSGDKVFIKGDSDSTTKSVYKVLGNGITTIRSGERKKNIIVTSYKDDIVIVKGDSTGIGILLNNSCMEFHGIIFVGFKNALEGKSKKTNILIDNCEFSHTKATGLRLRNIDTLVIRNSYVHHCYESGISMRNCSNVTLEKVQSSYNIDDKGIWGDADGFHSLDGDNINFIDCIALNNSEDGFDITSSGMLKNCISANHPACNVKLWRREVDMFKPKRMVLVNCLIYGAGEAGIKVTNGPELFLFNSVIFNNGQEGIAFRGVKIEQEPKVVISHIVNSIIALNNYGGIEVQQSGKNINKVIANYNLYFKNGRKNNSLFSDDNFIIGDPQFLDVSKFNFHLKHTSPAISKGISKEEFNKLYHSYGIDIIKDFNGKDRFINAESDLGIYVQN